MSLGSDLSDEALIVLAHCDRPEDVVSLATVAEATGVGARQLGEHIDELVAANRLTCTGDRTLAVLAAYEVPEPSAVAVTRADIESDGRYDWAVDRLLHSPHAGRETVILQGTEATSDQLTRVFESLPKECLSLFPGYLPELMQSSFDERFLAWERESIVPMLDNGRSNITVVDDQMFRHRIFREHTSILAQHGEYTYSAPRITQRLFIIDRQLAFVPLEPNDHRQGALMVRSPEIASTLVNLFREVVARATLFTFAKPNPVIRRQVLLLMAAGEKDEVIARKLNLSTRTVRRDVAAMMSLSGADSRFQLAIAAVRLGWLDPDDVAQPGRRSSQEQQEPQR